MCRGVSDKSTQTNLDIHTLSLSSPTPLHPLSLSQKNFIDKVCLPEGADHER